MSCFVIEKKQPTLHWGKKQVLRRGGVGWVAVSGVRVKIVEQTVKACRTKTRQCGGKVRDHLWKPIKAKKSCLKGYLATIKRLMRLKKISTHYWLHLESNPYRNKPQEIIA